MPGLSSHPSRECWCLDLANEIRSELQPVSRPRSSKSARRVEHDMDGWDTNENDQGDIHRPRRRSLIADWFLTGSRLPCLSCYRSCQREVSLERPQKEYSYTTRPCESKLTRRSSQSFPCTHRRYTNKRSR